MDHTKRFFLFAQAFTLALLAINIALAWLIPTLLDGHLLQNLLSLLRSALG